MWPAESLRTIDAPVLILNGKSDAAHQKVARLLAEIPTARFAACEGDHHSTPYQPTFHQAVVAFFHEQWRQRLA
jgi:pimeloyl-ACP methyl ester carboxylesterase